MCMDRTLKGKMNKMNVGRCAHCAPGPKARALIFAKMSRFALSYDHNGLDLMIALYVVRDLNAVSKHLQDHYSLCFQANGWQGLLEIIHVVPHAVSSIKLVELTWRVNTQACFGRL